MSNSSVSLAGTINSLVSGQECDTISCEDLGKMSRCAVLHENKTVVAICYNEQNQGIIINVLNAKDVWAKRLKMATGETVKKPIVIGLLDHFVSDFLD